MGWATTAGTTRPMNIHNSKIESAIGVSCGGALRVGLHVVLDRLAVRQGSEALRLEGARTRRTFPRESERISR